MKLTKVKILGGLLVILACISVSSRSVRSSALYHRDSSFTAAASRGDVQMMRILRFMGANVNQPAQGCEPAIIMAAEMGRTQAIEYLLGNGADVNKRDKFGETALVAASYSGNVGAVLVLIARNSDLSVVSEEGSALHVAKGRGHAQIVSILQSHGAVDRDERARRASELKGGCGR